MINKNEGVLWCCRNEVNIPGWKLSSGLRDGEAGDAVKGGLIFSLLRRVYW